MVSIILTLTFCRSCDFWFTVMVANDLKPLHRAPQRDLKPLPKPTCFKAPGMAQACH